MLVRKAQMKYTRQSMPMKSWKKPVESQFSAPIMPSSNNAVKRTEAGSKGGTTKTLDRFGRIWRIGSERVERRRQCRSKCEPETAWDR